jgi:signal transduction histidine kinase
VPATPELRALTALVQHQLNNPLAALLAEAQLLGMEDTLDPQHRAAVERITGLVRRVIGIVRDLDAAVDSRLPDR